MLKSIVYVPVRLHGKSSVLCAEGRVRMAGPRFKWRVGKPGQDK